VVEEIDNTTGYRATPGCPGDAHQMEWFLPGTAPIEFCPVHPPFRIGAGAGMVGGPPAAVPPPNPQDDPQPQAP